ncbi:Alanine racemase [hydrothermal vent metagenome]|uniref:Alanine racemase n=1 Tax=hydrothermal vent metagenome TaxID=652676 RepID=A0A3B0TCC5_9ZZZZ
MAMAPAPVPGHGHGHGGRLTIDLDALRANYRQMAGLAAPAECAAAVKADAYGLGLKPVSRALWQAGCRTFFVAHLSEAKRLRETLGAGPAVYVLNGLLPGQPPDFAALDARPVLCSGEQIAEWAEFCAQGATPKAAVMIDTGFNRLGLSAGELGALAADRSLAGGIDIALVISHLACADEPAHKLNAAQQKRLTAARKIFPDTQFGLSNSGGIHLGKPFAFDMVRTGIALYGGRAQASGGNPMAPVVRLDAAVIQVRDVPGGETIGYGATYRTKTPARVALLSIGYGDGFFRSLSASDDQPGGKVYFGDHEAKIIGRVSMDITAVDVTDVPHGLVTRGAWAQIIGPQQTAAALADDAGTIDYEVFTSLGSRYERIYSGLV